MLKPRLIYYNDARHYSLYRHDPPMSLHQFRQPVDEILGTGVDTLVYGLGSGQTFLHGSEVGRKWGESLTVHNRGVMWWRAAENLRLALAAGIDPLKVVVERAHQKNIRILCSLRMNDGTTVEAGNHYMLHPLKEEHPEILIGEEDPDNPAAAGCLNFADERVCQDRLNIIEEVCGRYGADGFEFDPYAGVFFKRSEVERNTPLLTSFVRQARQILDRIGTARGTTLSLAARIDPVEKTNLKRGMDVRTWLEEGLLNLAVVHRAGFLLDQELSVDWLVDAAGRCDAGVYTSPGRVPYDDRHHEVTIEMMRAAASNFVHAGLDGIYIADLPWPLAEREYAMLRELGDPDIYARRKKHYFAPFGRKSPDPAHEKTGCLPVELRQGQMAAIPFTVGDDLAGARRDDELRGIILGVRIVQYCPEDEMDFTFNGVTLAPTSTTHFYGGLVAYGAHRAGLPERIDTYHWFAFDVPLDLVHRGTNELEVLPQLIFAGLDGVRVLHQVELQIEYSEPFLTREGQM